MVQISWSEVKASASNGTASNSVSFDTALLDRLWKYNSAIDPDALIRALHSLGHPKRLRHFASKLAAGQKVSVIALGASITVGEGQSGNGFVRQFFKWINVTFPLPDSAQHELINHGLRAVPSDFFR